MREYVWSSGSRWGKFPASKVFEQLEVIREQKGRIKAADVVFEAQKEHEKGFGTLRELFEWDDAKAGNLHRLNTARMVIRSIQVKDRGKPPLRVYAAAQLPGEKSKSYRPLTELLKNKGYRRTLLQQAQREYMRARQKYAQLQELAGLHMKIDEEIGRLREMNREPVHVRLTGARI